MTTTFNDDLVVAGAISAANFQFGSVVISPQTNEVTDVEVTGLNLKGTGDVFTLLGTDTPYPWTRVQEVSHRFSSVTGFTAYIFRTNGSDTNVHWMSMMAAAL